MASFQFLVEEVFTIDGVKGVFASGMVESGRVDPCDIACLNGDPSKECKIRRIEGPRLLLDYAKKGANVALLLEGIDVDAVSAGDRISFVRPSNP